MSPTRRLSRLALAALVALAPPSLARADQASTEAEVAAPAPEPAATPVASDPSAEPGFAGEPAPDGERPIMAEPIEAVHRPDGVWGPLAIAADVLVMRPIGAASLAAGGAAFVLVSPVAAATGTLGSRVDALRDRARDVFTRPLGAL
jgi:hypothetical protein